MTEPVVLVFGAADGMAALRQAVRDLGGEDTPGGLGELRLSAGRSHVWVYEQGPDEWVAPEDAERYHELLGGTPAGAATVLPGGDDGERLALDVVRRLAGRTPFVVDDGHGWIGMPSEAPARWANDPGDGVS